MRNELKDKEYRDAYAKAFMRNSIAFQILAMRKKAGLSQKELGDLCGMKQNAISRLEDPDYGKLSLETLGKLAAAFDVVPWAGFLSFADMEFRRRDLSPAALTLNTFAEDDEEGERASLLWADGDGNLIVDQRSSKTDTNGRSIEDDAAQHTGDIYGQAACY